MSEGSNLDDESWPTPGFTVKATTYGRVPGWVILSPDIPHNSKVLYAYISLRADNSTHVWRTPKQRMADELGWSLSTVERALRALVDQKIVQVTKRFNRMGNDWNEYALVFDERDR